jgi:2-methylisocitrate lyase-like PEP mutase family enzyme
MTMINSSQKDKARLFLKFHTDREILVLLNSWDPGSSRLMEKIGFRAIATSSMAVAASLGYPDGQAIPFREMTEAISRIVNKVSLPVTADIEGGYGNNAKEIVESVEKVIATGIVGINIEDSNQSDAKLLEVNEFCERLSAIRKLSDSLGFHLVINVRTDVFLARWGDPEKRLAESVRRGNKYREAGADCIFIPDVWEEDKIATLVKEIDAPINILVNPTNGTGLPPPVIRLQELGVARVSLGSSLMKATLSVSKKIGDELLHGGTYNALNNYLSPIEETLKAYRMAVG